MFYRYQILIEYLGTGFIGWQKQKKGRSIQSCIQKNISKLLKHKVNVYGSGRTDAGVHAIEQSAHFDTNQKIKNLNIFIKSLNFFLNKQNISILKIAKKPLKFHARHSAKKRYYIYIIRNGISPSVINFNKEWHIIKPLDIDLLKRGTKKLVGTHNFSTFRASNCNSKSAKKTIYKIQVIKKKNIIKIRFISRSYLKSQVRSMVGCLKYLSEKKWSLQKFEKIFKSCNRESCAPLAPPHGLYLEKITY